MRVAHDAAVIRAAFDEWVKTVNIPRGSLSERLLFAAWFQGWIGGDASARRQIDNDLNDLAKYRLR